jgi:hypothetical protein
VENFFKNKYFFSDRIVASGDEELSIDDCCTGLVSAFLHRGQRQPAFA